MRLFKPLAVLVAYLGIAALITYPLVLGMSDVFAGFPYGDAYENARHVWWMTHALRTGQPLFFQPLLAYPDGIAGLTLQATPLLLFPGWLFALALPLPVAYNLHVLLTLALNGWAMFGFVKALTGRRDAAFIAGVVFMSYPTLQGHLGVSHINILAQWGVPLYAWGLWRLTQSANSTGTRNRPSIGWSILWVAAAFVAVTWAHTIQAIYTLLPITTFFMIRSLLRKDVFALRRIVLGAVLGATLTLLWLLPVLGDAFDGTYTGDGGSVRYSADLLAASTPSFFHPLWGNLPHTRAVLGINLDEGAGYIGLIAGALVLLGIWRIRDARPWLALALAAYVLALGPLLKWNDQPVQFTSDGYISGIALPWALLERLPGFELARTPGRFNLTTGFAIAVMVAYGAAWGLARIRGREVQAVLIAACAGLILFDYQTFFPLPTTRTDIPQAIYDLRQRDDVRAVFDIPWANLLAAKDALYLQTAHQHPLIAGHVTRRTPVDPAKLTILETVLDPVLLDEAGADILILHKAYVDETERARLIVALGEPFYEDDRFALFERSAVATEPTYTALIHPDGAQAYLYAPESILVTMEMGLAGSIGQAALTLDGRRLWAGVCSPLPDGRQECRPYNNDFVGTPFLASDASSPVSMRLPLVLPQGYSTLALTVDSPCPTRIMPPLRCDMAALAPFISDFAASVGTSAEFEDGIRLEASHVTQSDSEVEAWLIWAFDELPAPYTIRFVHLLDSRDQLVAQVDNAPGVPSPGGWSEIVTLPLPDDLPPGEYRVVVGWYRLPDVTPILALGEDAGATRVEVGRVTIGQE